MFFFFPPCSYIIKKLIFVFTNGLYYNYSMNDKNYLSAIKPQKNLCIKVVSKSNFVCSIYSGRHYCKVMPSRSQKESQNFKVFHRLFLLGNSRINLTAVVGLSFITIDTQKCFYQV